jgi:hypothetical protein
MMSARLKKLALTFVVITILALALTTIRIAISEDEKAKIDLFTQKEPYDGKGSNAPSDAFSPDELVILYAHVMYNETPLQNLLVAFYVRAPNNASFFLSERTNASGIAAINFTIPWPCTDVSVVFGEWYALASALVGNTVIKDSLTFRVGWLVELVSIRTIDENLTYRLSFGIGGAVGLEIALRNIAKVLKTATIAITIQDELDVPVSSYTLYNFKAQPNGKIVFLYCKLNIPKWAHIGEATIFVSALTKPVNESGYPYCPTISTKFYIAPYSPLAVSFHDIAVVDITLSAKDIEIGQTLNIGVLVQNEGTENESFKVNAYYNDSLIREVLVTLNPYSCVNLNFTLDTTSIAPGKYIISASIFPLENEADLTDNTLVNGEVEVRPKLPIIIHDIAIVNVKTSSNIVFIGDLLQINVSIINKGTAIETFNVEVYYNLSLIEIRTINNFEPGAYQTLIFVWNTSMMSEGVYQISAFAPLINDDNILDNQFVNGLVQVIKAPKIQYFLKIRTEPENVTAILGEGWYEFDTSVNLTAPYIVPTFGVRYLFLYWDVDGVSYGLGVNTIAVVMDGNHTATAHYVLQYYLTVQSPYGTPGGAGWYNAGSVAYATLNLGLLEHGNGTRRVFTSWGGDASGMFYNQSNPILMDGPKTAIALWKTQFYLSVRVDPAGIATVPGEGWYDAGVNVVLSAPHVAGYHFSNWDINGVSQGSGVSVITVLMDSPRTATAHYAKEVTPWAWFLPEWFYWLLLLLLLLLIILLLILYYRRRRKEAGEFHSGWTAWYYRYNLREDRKIG